MPDPNEAPRVSAASAPTLYPQSRDSATTGLRQLIRERIGARGAMAFPEFMELALYHPEAGYYARGSSQIGRVGDFFTSVSVGPLFGHLLALRAVSWWEESRKPPRWQWLEIGAHNGNLAADALDALARLVPAAVAGLRYTIVEPLAALRRTQREALARYGGLVSVVASAGEIPAPPLPTFLVANEVLDALPFHVMARDSGRWRERRVTCDAACGFLWTMAEIAAGPLADALDPVPGDLPDGYQTEVRAGFREFLSQYLPAMEHGRMVWIDYGFAAGDYYIAGRSQGTLRTFRGHRAGECPLADPGGEDITAHVDFTAFARDAMTMGVEPDRFENQGTWLVRVAERWLRTREGVTDPAMVRQFQTLTHPAHLGAKFQVLELAWNEATGPATSRAARERLGFA